MKWPVSKDHLRKKGDVVTWQQRQADVQPCRKLFGSRLTFLVFRCKFSRLFQASWDNGRTYLTQRPRLRSNQGRRIWCDLTSRCAQSKGLGWERWWWWWGNHQSILSRQACSIISRFASPFWVPRIHKNRSHLYRATRDSKTYRERAQNYKSFRKVKSIQLRQYKS